MSTPLRATVAFQELIGSMRQHWANQLYPALHERYREIDHGATPAMADQAIAQISQTPLYQWFAFIERHYQRMKYSDPRWGLAASFESRPEWVRERLAAAESSPSLELNPNLPIPGYYREIDIHQHPGNLIGADYDGLMYQASATSIHPNTRRFEAHERFGDRVLGVDSASAHFPLQPACPKQPSQALICPLPVYGSLQPRYPTPGCQTFGSLSAMR